MEDRNECLIANYPGLIPFECFEKIPEFSKKYICKIKTEETKGTGFFCKIPFPDKDRMIPTLITNNHILNREILYKIDANIQIDIKDNNDIKIINLDKNRMKYTSNKNEYDITILEIKEEDNIKNYLELDERIINDIIEKNNNKNKEFIDETIFIIHYPKNKLSFSCGILKDIFQEKKSNFIHLCATEEGSSGAPILNLNNKVIGIHKGGIYNINNYNQGTFLNDPIKEFIQLNYKTFKNEPTYKNEKIKIISNPPLNKFNEIKNISDGRNELLEPKNKKKNFIKNINENENSNISVELTPNNRVSKNDNLKDKMVLKSENIIFHSPLYRPKKRKSIIFTNELINNYEYDIKYPGNIQLKNKLKEINLSMRINSKDNLISDKIDSNIKYLNQNNKKIEDGKNNHKYNESLDSFYRHSSDIIQKRICEGNCKCQ